MCMSLSAVPPVTLFFLPLFFFLFPLKWVCNETTSADQDCLWDFSIHMDCTSVLFHFYDALTLLNQMLIGWRRSWPRKYPSFRIKSIHPPISQSSKATINFSNNYKPKVDFFVDKWRFSNWLKALRIFQIEPVCCNSILNKLPCSFLSLSLSLLSLSSSHTSTVCAC